MRDLSGAVWCSGASFPVFNGLGSDTYLTGRGNGNVGTPLALLLPRVSLGSYMTPSSSLQVQVVSGSFRALLPYRFVSLALMTATLAPAYIR